MSGILDTKTRILDSIVTLEGRKQISSGRLKIEYVSFSDSATFYKADIVSGSADATKRIFFEACHLPQDEITFEADDSGKLHSFKNDSALQLHAGQLISFSFVPQVSSVITGSSDNITTLRGTEFASQIEGILTSSIDNFKKLQLIGTRDKIFDEEAFAIGNANIEFVIHNERPVADPNQWVANINHLESLFSDPRLSRLPNFYYLPPVNKVTDASIDKRDSRNLSSQQLGNFPPWGKTHVEPLTYDQIKTELNTYEKQGYMKTVSFEPTSRNNRIVAQFFETSHDSVTKLDVIDFGLLQNSNSRQPVSQLFFVGKVIVDDNDTHTFIHLFTMLFE